MGLDSFLKQQKFTHSLVQKVKCPLGHTYKSSNNLDFQEVTQVLPSFDSLVSTENIQSLFQSQNQNLIYPQNPLIRHNRKNFHAKITLKIDPV